jgi:hypothetical protein
LKPSKARKQWFSASPRERKEYCNRPRKSQQVQQQRQWSEASAIETNIPGQDTQVRSTKTGANGEERQHSQSLKVHDSMRIPFHTI